ncbi:hypothetical protein FOQG_15997 [Fusarium oxysporum f. sp. raphani 54005]|uniref:Uncharacterized protein n=15 Tax=Fusarium oxysporum species complex TaxID=171631 RepID=A0A2H3T1Z6_FUSOX|nr:hypothetical protein FOXG_18684 [Fusarium oxysporum f. sp. lycopersici 4287]XP_031050190.1 uncharacterized protein FOBCDRAFT_214764 [Fusarium oxysporum Fo47]XP_031054477.1 uncharacterized protein FOIG_14587 [Fusarium odoratissimum NRRL 54006]EWZ01273.1 hypothetical protein FOYG_00931 [Fusarium oxysporum NRRL 32931]EWZ82480.1 hypothetical protein FOWG_14142 [Fusarium oxysporum f. sp. lycopersici MN25]EXA43111.1 hypothetical protein FOVG_08139 [Fusarium oxysporum f. sp. pisi HDV247]EXK44636.
MQPVLRVMPTGQKIVPLLLTVGSATVVGGCVRTQLKTQSRTFDRKFSQYNTAQSEQTMKTVIHELWLEA